MNETIQNISLDLIEPAPRNRIIGGFDQEKLEQLAESIKAVGVQQPAVVRPLALNPDSPVQYQIVAGERRWRASRIAGKDTLPCVVRDIDDVTALKIQYIENLQRDDVHPLDEADGYEQLVAHAGYTVEVLASEVGKSASYVYQRLKLSKLTKKARELFVQNKITAGHAILLARLTPNQQQQIIEEDLFEPSFGGEEEIISVRELTDYIHNRLMLDMKKITWKMDDAELLPEAGSCRECPKRTGYQPALFADVCKDTKKDYCTNGACYSMKQELVVGKRQADLEGQEYIMAADSYADAPKGVLRQYEWNECKKSEPGAKRVLIVAGEQPGRLTWGIPRVNTSNLSKAEVDYKAQQKKEQEKAKKATADREARVDKVLRAAENYMPNPAQPLYSELGKLPLEALRICVQKIWDSWEYQERCAIAQAKGWGDEVDCDLEKDIEKRIKEMNEIQMGILLLHLAMSDEIRVSQYSAPRTEAINALEKIYGITKLAKKKGGKE